MNRNFAILGIREDATKDQVKAAYELRMKKYKSSDYDDDPDYVRRKIAQLKEAYEAAYSVAGTEDAYSRNDFDRSQSYEPDHYKPREYKPEKYNHDKFERDRDLAAEKGEDRRFKTPDISRLKGKMDALKTTVSEGMSEIAGEIRKGQELRDDEESFERHTSDAPRTKEGLRRLDGSKSGRIIEPTPQPVAGSSPRLDSSGSGNVVETPPGAGAPVYHEDDDGFSMTSKSAGTIIAILIAVVMMFISMCDDGPSYDYDDYGSYYSYEYYNEEDQRIHDTALDANYLLDQQDMADSYSLYSFSDEKLEAEGEKFVKNYFEYDSLEEVRQYLYENYEEFAVESIEGYQYKLTEILDFYGFKEFVYAEGIIDPYTGKPIVNLVEYLNYLNAYYKEYGLTE